MPSNSTPTRLPSTTRPSPPTPASSAGILDVVDLVELDVPIVTVARLDLTDVDVLDNVARCRIDRHRAPWARPCHALHRRDDLLAVPRASGFLDGLVDETHAVVAPDRMKVRPHAAVRFHEAVDVGLVLGRR